MLVYDLERIRGVDPMHGATGLSYTITELF